MSKRKFFQQAIYNQKIFILVSNVISTNLPFVGPKLLTFSVDNFLVVVCTIAIHQNKFKLV